MKPKYIIALSVLLSALPLLAQATTNVPNPINGIAPGDTTVVQIVVAAFTGFAGLFSLFAFGFLIINSFKMIVSVGNEQMVSKAKSGVTWSVAGFVIALLAFSLVSSTFNFLGGIDRNELEDPNNLVPPIRPCGSDYGFVCVFTRVIEGVLGLAGVAAIGVIVYGGYLLITSAGNENMVSRGKAVLKWAVLGLVLILLAFVIINGVNLIFTSGGAEV